MTESIGRLVLVGCLGDARVCHLVETHPLLSLF